MKIMKAADIMTKEVITAKQQTPLTEVMETLLSKRISGLPVVNDEGLLEGIVSEIDLVNSMFSGNADETTVGEIMSTNITFFPPDATCAEMASCFITNRIRRVPICDHGKVVGIVSRRDILKHFLTQYNQIKSVRKV